MTKWTIGTGAVVTVIGIVAYIASGASSLTALIPAALGILLVIAGLISRKEAAHRHAIHAALAVALVGLAGTLMNVLKLGELLWGTAERPIAVIASTLTFVALLVYLVLGVTSFIRARRSRRA